MVTNVVESPWGTRTERQSSRDAKRDAVIVTAARLFTESGFQGTSLDDIARSLQVSKPTLYHYVANKEEILFACVQRGLDALAGGIAEVTAQGLTGRDRLRAAMEIYAGVVTGDFGLCVIRVGEDPLSETKRRELRALKRRADAAFQALVQAGMDEGWIVPGDPSLAAYTVVSALTGIGRWYRPGDHAVHSLQDAIGHCVEMLMRGVLHEPSPTAWRATIDDNRQGAVAMPAMRREVHFGDRVVRCFVDRLRTLRRCWRRPRRSAPTLRRPCVAISD